MMYCTKCGSDLKGNRVRCPVCGYEVQKMKMELSRPRTARSQEKRERKPWAPPIPDQRKEPSETDEKDEDVPEEADNEEEDPQEEDPRYVEGCAICGRRPVRRCFFTLAPLCERHTVWMQIYVRNMPFGERVPASPDMASDKEGRVPTQSEAQEAGMFFTIKPYHTWRKV